MRLRSTFPPFVSCLLLLSILSCNDQVSFGSDKEAVASAVKSRLPKADENGSSIAQAALTLTKDHVVYDPAYFNIPYPGGDVPQGKGVCTDVVIRTFRKMDIDLQKEVHEDMKKRFSAYPKIWGMKTTDPNIDHRRVPNLMVFFSRKGAERTITKNGADYLPGDIVAWQLDGGQTHIGVVSGVPSNDDRRYQIVHNIGGGQVLEDCLFQFKIIGHYRYTK